MKLTEQTVKAMKPKDKRQEVPDSLCVGLYLVVQKSGKKSWQVRYRTAGAHRRMTLGAYPVLSLADARRRAREVLAAAAEGRDPAEEVRAAKAPKVNVDRDKFWFLVQQYEKRHLSTLKSGATVKREIERHAGAVWGDRDVHDISKRDVIDLLDDIMDSGRKVTANRLRAYLKAFFNWCIERDVIGVNPVQGVKRPLKDEKSRDRVLSDEEIRWFWKACEQEGQPWGHMGKLLLLTGQRLGEVSGMTYGEVNGDLWSMAGERTKNKRPHDVPLSTAALAVLRDVKRIKGKAGYVITTTGKTPVQSFDKPRRRLAASMQEIASEELGRKVEIPHWTFHDLRRTCATGMQRLGVPVRVTEAVLNHVSGTGGGIVGVYQRHDYAEEKREAINAWSEKVMELQAKS